jgi:hypothetical protein
MVKTHDNSRFAMLTLEGVVSCKDTILQILKTDSTFTDSKKEIFLCEVIAPSLYRPAEPWHLHNELIRVNQDRDRLQRKCEKQTNRIVLLEKTVTTLDAQIRREREERKAAAP